MKKIKMIFIFSIITYFSFIIPTLDIGFYSKNKQPISYDLIIEDYRINNYIKKLFPKYTIRKITELKDKKVLNDVTDHSQHHLNTYYNNHLKEGMQKITGTCTIVATLNILEFHSKVKNKFKMYDSSEEEFTKIFNLNFKNGYIDQNSGTNSNKHGHILYDSYNFYSNKNEYKITNHGYDVRRLIRDDITKNDGAIMFTVPGHTVIGKGVTYFDVEMYDSKNKSHNETLEFFIVSEGWWENIDGYIYSKNITNWWNGNTATTMRLKK